MRPALQVYNVWLAQVFDVCFGSGIYCLAWLRYKGNVWLRYFMFGLAQVHTGPYLLFALGQVSDVWIGPGTCYLVWFSYLMFGLAQVPAIWFGLGISCLVWLRHLLFGLA